MSTDTLDPPALTDQERADLCSLAARRDVLARSEINRRAHVLVEHTRMLLERIETFLGTFTGDEAAELLASAFPNQDLPTEPYRWGTNTFVDPLHQFDQLTRSLADFLQLGPCDLPPLPNADKEVIRG